MQLGTDRFFHLTYCSNIHPGERWEDVARNVQTHVPALKARLAPNAPFGIGLRLSDQAARDLLQGDELQRFKAWLDEKDLYVFTLNGFPYGGFHRQVVKDQVYAPDWRTRERTDYTLRLVQILDALLPEGLEGGISTSPISYKPWMHGHASEETVAFRTGSRHLAEVTATLVRLRSYTGKLIHIDVEPEPDCLIENLSETVYFFEQWLLPEGRAYLAEHLGISEEEAEDHLREHVRLCYDTCHFAVEYENPGTVMNRLREAGIRIGKVQISAALKVALPEAPDERRAVAARLAPFAESTYLHQVVERLPDDTLRHYPDLVTALPLLEQTQGVEWRIHFHVPIFVDDYEMLRSTQDDLVAALDVIGSERLCPHLEIETYTWDVLPPALKMDLQASIGREYDWVLSVFDGA